MQSELVFTILTPTILTACDAMVNSIEDTNQLFTRTCYAIDLFTELKKRFELGVIVWLIALFKVEVAHQQVIFLNYSATLKCRPMPK